MRACVCHKTPHPQKSSVTKNSRPHPEKMVGHKTRDPIPRNRSVTKLEPPSRKKARSQNSRPQPEKWLGHKTRDPNPKSGSVTKLKTPHPERRFGHKTRHLIHAARAMRAATIGRRNCLLPKGASPRGSCGPPCADQWPSSVSATVRRSMQDAKVAAMQEARESPWRGLGGGGRHSGEEGGGERVQQLSLQ